MNNGNENKCVVVTKKVSKTLNDGTKLVVRKVRSFGEKRFGKVKGTYILAGIFCVFVLLLGIKLFGGKTIDYPVVYNSSEGDLYLLGVQDKDSEKSVKLARKESTSNVVYANTSDRYVLFQKEQNLYLYDAKNKEQTVKIMDNIEEFYFTEDDKFIIGLDSSRSLLVYNYKDTVKLDADVSSLYILSKDRVVYEKEGKVYVRSIHPKKDDRKKITEEYDSNIQFSEDGSRILYLSNEKDLYSYNIKKDKNERIASKVSAYYCGSDACKKLFYVETDDGKNIYYYDGKDSTKVASDIHSLHASDVAAKRVVYSMITEGKYNLYYMQVGESAVAIEENLTSIKTVRIYEGKEIYYITGKNEAKYVDIKGAKIGKVRDLASDVTGYFQAYKDGYAFVGDISKGSSGTLYMVSHGRVKKIDENVNANILTVNKDGDKIYYLKDYKTTGNLFVTSGGKSKKIDDDVYTLEYVKDNLIYYIKDYTTSKSRGDLYRYTGKSMKIAEDVTKLANPPVVYTVD